MHASAAAHRKRFLIDWGGSKVIQEWVDSQFLIQAASTADRICVCLKNLRKQREEILIYRANTEKESQELLKQIESEKPKIVIEFRQLHQYLNEQETRLLLEVEAADREVVNKRNEHVARLTEELSSLDDVIQELEEKRQEMASELLEDVVSTLQRCEQKKFENPVAFPPVLKLKIWEYSGLIPILGNVMKILKVNVILDPDTAHPQILISKDHKCLTLEEKQEGPISNNETLVYNQFVLGHVLPFRGRYFWDVGDEEGWAVGLSVSSVGTKNNKVLNPDAGVWAIGK